MAERKDVGRLWNKRWLLVVLYVAVIFVLSAQPGLSLPGTFEFKDKVAHALEYAGLSWLVHGATRVSWPEVSVRRRVVGALVAIGLMGVADEIFQMSVPMRDSSPFDWLADMVGATLAQAVAALRETRRGGA